MPGTRRPTPRPVRRHHDDGRLAPGLAHQIDSTVEQHPPAGGGSALVEQLLTFVEVNLLADGNQLEQLLVAEPVEQEQRPQIVDADHVVAR
jgi:hypothetical protein